MQKEITGTCSITATFGPDAGLFERLERILRIDLCFKILGVNRFLCAHVIEKGNVAIATIAMDKRDLEHWFAIAEREAAQQAEQDAAEDSAMRR